MGAFLAGTGSVMVKDGMDGGGVISCMMTEDVTTLLEYCFVWTISCGQYVSRLRTLRARFVLWVCLPQSFVRTSS